MGWTGVTSISDSTLHSAMKSKILAGISTNELINTPANNPFEWASEMERISLKATDVSDSRTMPKMKASVHDATAKSLNLFTKKK